MKSKAPASGVPARPRVFFLIPLEPTRGSFEISHAPHRPGITTSYRHCFAWPSQGGDTAMSLTQTRGRAGYVCATPIWHRPTSFRPDAGAQSTVRKDADLAVARLSPFARSADSRSREIDDRAEMRSERTDIAHSRVSAIPIHKSCSYNHSTRSGTLRVGAFVAQSSLDGARWPANGTRKCQRVKRPASAGFDTNPPLAHGGTTSGLGLTHEP